VPALFARHFLTTDTLEEAGAGRKKKRAEEIGVPWALPEAAAA
jgi:hypothetical protein